MTDTVEPVPASTRRQLIAGGLVLGAALAGGKLTLGPDYASAASGPWTFTDDRNKKITRSSVPKRIVAYNDSAAALFGYGITPVGVFGDSPKKDPALAGLPWSKVVELGTAYGEIKLEALAALKPDLIVTTWYPPPTDSVPFGFKDKSQLQLVEKIVPVLSLNGHVVGSRALQKFRRIVAALDVDMKAPAIVKAQADFNAAAVSLKAAAASKKPALRVLALSLYGQNVYLARPRDHADLAYFRTLGVDIIVPDTKESYWEVISLEQIGKYPADIVIHDARTGNPTLEELLKVPAFASLPAVKAGQVAKWRAATPLDYGSYAKNMVALAGTLRKARRI